MADRLAGEHGVVRAAVAGRVSGIGGNWVEITPLDRRARTVVGCGPATPSTTGVNGLWRPLVHVGDPVWPGDLLAVAPDVVIADGVPHLAQGRDCLVAYMPWHGWNFEDAIVVSSALVGEFTSSHLLSFREPLDLLHGEMPTFTVKEHARVEEGDVLAEVWANGRLRRSIRATVGGEVGRLGLLNDEVIVELRVDRPLAIGDKLTNRHGAKGVVATIVPEADMPHLPDGRQLQVILNPLGVIRRLNISQLLETHVTLHSDLSGSVGTQVVGRRLDSPEHLAAALAQLGAPGGRLSITSSDGSPVGPPDGVVVGWQHIVKLDHVAANKERARHTGWRSPVNQQPTKGSDWVAGRLVGGSQRLGEMEFWALQAVSADRLVHDAHQRSDVGTASLEAVAAHLRVGGIRVTWDDAVGFQTTLDFHGDGLEDLPRTS